MAVAHILHQHSRSIALLDMTTATGRQHPNRRGDRTNGSSIVPVFHAKRSAEVEIGYISGRYCDIVIDTDDLCTPIGISPLVIANIAVIAITPSITQGPSIQDALLARIERAWLFNPRIKVLFVPVGCSKTQLGHHHVLLKGVLGIAPSFRLLPGSMSDLRTLAGVLTDPKSSCRQELSMLCNEIYAA